MSVRTWAIATAACGAAALLILLAFSQLPEARAAYEQGQLAPAMSLFQRAETPADLTRVFGVPPNQAALAAMHAVNRLDLWAFAPAYTLFLIAAAAMLAGGLRGPMALAAVLFAVLGGGADAIETAAQLRITADYSAAPAHLPIAPWHWLKYSALAANAWVMAAMCLLPQPRRWVLGVVMLLPLPVVLLAWLGAIETRVFSAAFALAWLTLLVLAIRQSIAGKGAPPSAQTR